MNRRTTAVAAVCLGSGGLIAFSMPPWGWWPLAFVGLAGLDRAIADQAARSRFVRAFLVGIGWLFPSTIWMWDLTPPGYIVAGLVFSAYFGLGGMLCPPGAPARWIGLPALVVLAEAARWYWPFGGVPLSTLAMSQADAPLAPTVRILGPLLLVGLTAMAGVGLSALFARSGKVALAIIAVLAVAVAFAQIAPKGEVVGELDIAIVQGGGPQRTRAVDTNARDVFDRHLAASTLVEPPVDVVIWPEDVVDVEGLFLDSPEYGELQALARNLHTTLVPGITENVDDETFLNASVVFSPDGELLDRYDKVQRVPFGEYFPFRSFIERFASETIPRREARAGVGEATLDTGEGKLGVAISWEIFFDRRARDAIGNGGEVLVNPTNGSSYWLTIVQSQQVASSRLRALETGRWVLQAAPTGFSAVISPDGEVTARTGVSEQRVIQGTIDRRTGLTFATRVGVWPMLVLALLGAAAAWAVDERDRRETLRPVRTGPRLRSLSATTPFPD